MKKEMIVTSSVLVLALTGSLTGCGEASMTLGGRDPQAGYVRFEGDAQGVEAFGSVFQGVIEGAKTSTGASPTIQNTVKTKAVERTRRAIGESSFLERAMGFQPQVPPPYREGTGRVRVEPQVGPQGS